MRDISLIVVHCSATPPDMDIGREEITDWHRDRGWSDIGYHYVIRRNGDIEAGRMVQKAGAHARGHNANSIGICLVGGVRRDGSAMVPDNNFMPAQYESLAILIQGLSIAFNLDYEDPAQVCGHRDLPGVRKACPCFDVPGWVELWAGTRFPFEV